MSLSTRWSISKRALIDVSLTICPIMDGKAITGASVVARDITERKRAAALLPNKPLR